MDRRKSNWSVALRAQPIWKRIEYMSVAGMVMHITQLHLHIMMLNINIWRLMYTIILHCRLKA